MFKVRAWLAVLLGLTLLATACGGEVTEDAGEDSVATTDDAAGDDTAEDSSDDSSSEDATTDDAVAANPIAALIAVSPVVSVPIPVSVSPRVLRFVGVIGVVGGVVPVPPRVVGLVGIMTVMR